MSPLTSNVNYDKQHLYTQLAAFVKSNESIAKSAYCDSKTYTFDKTTWSAKTFMSISNYMESLLQLNLFANISYNYIDWINEQGKKITNETYLNSYEPFAPLLSSVGIPVAIATMSQTILQLAKSSVSTNEIDEIRSYLTKNLDQEDVRLVNQAIEIEKIQQRLAKRTKRMHISELIRGVSACILFGVTASAAYNDFSNDRYVKLMLKTAIYLGAGSHLDRYVRLRLNDIEVEYLDKMTAILKRMLPETSL